MSEITPQKRELALKQILAQKEKVDYDIRDFTIDYIVQEFNKKRFFIPNYQRQFVWNKNTQSRFIESILLGLPIPFLFLGTDPETSNFEIVDGAQRIQTLVTFIGNKLRLINLESLNSINKFYFKDLPAKLQRTIENTALRMIVLSEKTTLETRQEIFNRINTSSLKASPTEIRMGSFDGPFTEFIKKLSLNEKFIKLAPLSAQKLSRKEDYELLFRFFAYSDNLNHYNNEPANFIDSYVEKHKDKFDKERFYSEFNNTIEFVDKYFPYGFKKNKNASFTPKARFEAISVGVNLALRENPNLKVDNVDWIQSNEFEKITTSDGANNKSRLLGRINYVKDKLLESNINE